MHPSFRCGASYFLRTLGGVAGAAALICCTWRVSAMAAEASHVRWLADYRALPFGPIQVLALFAWLARAILVES